MTTTDLDRLEPASHTFTSLDLFLFSAVSWHPHRIHFDQDYAREEEGHADLLVHGPLQAIHLCRTFTEQRPDVEVRSVTYRHLAALHVGVPVRLLGARVPDAGEEGEVVYDLAMETESGERTTTCRVVARPHTAA